MRPLDAALGFRVRTDSMFGLHWPGRKPKWLSRQMKEVWSLTAPLMQFSQQDVLSLGRAIEGILILGATGGGKSSGSGRRIALAYLRAGFGGLVLCGKADERRAWETYCREAGRSEDLVIFGPDHRWRFNFIEYELNRKGTGAGLTENLVNLFTTVLEVLERNNSQGSGRDEEGYWRRANRQLCRNAVDALVLAKGHISVPELYRLVISAPTSLEQVQSEAWRKQSFCFQCLREAEQRLQTPRQRKDFEIVADYFLVEFANLSEKTRSVVVSTFTSMIDILNRGVLSELFCSDLNITPEAIPAGKIIVVDMSVKEYAEVGLLAQILWKYNFQRSIERRDIAANPRPVFLWQDEGQLFVTPSFDMQFQTTCRAARVANVILSQNISNYYAALGGSQKGQAEVDSLFGNLNLKIFHCNSDPVTNEWAAKLIGRTRQFMVNANNNYQSADWFSVMTGMSDQQASAGISEIFEFEVQPSAFTRLRTGGPAHGWNVDAIVFSGGMCFNATGRNWMPVTFRIPAEVIEKV
jgi:hypothetical protein